MTINRYDLHILILPEDDANRQIANGFYLDLNLNSRAFKVLPAARGWGDVIEQFQKDYVPKMRQYPKTMIALLIDFDDYNESDGLSYENRLVYIKSQVPDDLQERVFVLGSRTAPEKLKNDMKKSFEEIGEALAKDCSENTDKAWGHQLLRHNQTELERMIRSVKPFLFGIGED